jgi:hypothetical protein
MTEPVEHVSGNSASPSRCRNAAIWMRGTLSFGQNRRVLPSMIAHPVVTPRSAIQVTAGHNGSLAITSLKTYVGPGQNCACAAFGNAPRPSNSINASQYLRIK